MPIFTYECETCGNIFDVTCSIAERPKKAACSDCGGDSYQIIVPGHGGLQTDTPRWLDDEVRTCLGADVRTRSDLARVLKEKNWEPAC
jgi:putative FmdB family regulatory protein